jgi:hypothetical protein
MPLGLVSGLHADGRRSPYSHTSAIDELKVRLLPENRWDRNNCDKNYCSSENCDSNDSHEF